MNSLITSFPPTKWWDNSQFLLPQRAAPSPATRSALGSPSSAAEQMSQTKGAEIADWHQSAF